MQITTQITTVTIGFFMIVADIVSAQNVLYWHYLASAKARWMSQFYPLHWSVLFASAASRSIPKSPTKGASYRIHNLVDAVDAGSNFQTLLLTSTIITEIQPN